MTQRLVIFYIFQQLAESQKKTGNRGTANLPKHLSGEEMIRILEEKQANKIEEENKERRRVEREIKKKEKEEKKDSEETKERGRENRKRKT